MAPPLQSSFGDRFRCQGFLGSCHRRTTLQTLWQYALRFQIEELFDSKSGAFELTVQGYAHRFERLYLVAAVALLYATTQGMAVQLAGCQQVDPTGDVA